MKRVLLASLLALLYRNEAGWHQQAFTNLLSSQQSARTSSRRDIAIRTLTPFLAATSLRAAAIEVDPEYPGTAVERLRNIQERVKSLSAADLSCDWEEVRLKLLWAGGLKDLQDVQPGRGYTGHAFNDDNHCDLTPMLGDVAYNRNDGSVANIAVGNILGPGIETASLPELGPGGSWSTCTNGCKLTPPKDVAHVQFRSRIAFKLVWCPPSFSEFVLVDDSGNLLNSGKPTGQLPALGYRSGNYELVKGSRYAEEAVKRR